MNSALCRLITPGTYGFLTSKEMEDELIREFPRMIVAVRMGCSERFTCEIQHVRARIAALEKQNPHDYCRDVFIPVNHLDALRAALGMGKGD